MSSGDGSLALLFVWLALSFGWVVGALAFGRFLYCFLFVPCLLLCSVTGEMMIVPGSFTQCSLFSLVGGGRW